jgi:GNAT superfamily N-acetyltransferase
MNEISLRQMTEIDFSFVLASWLRNYKSNSSFAMRIKKAIYYAFHEPIAKHILRKPTTRTLVAYATESEEVTIGFLVYEILPRDHHVIHFCYVKPAFRRMGIASRLFQESGLNLTQCEYSHRTYDFDDMKKENENFKKRCEGLIYNPYRL